MIVFDTNAVLRFLLRDHEEMAMSVRTQMRQSTYTLTTEVLAEVVYVLFKTYKVDRDRVSRELLALLDDTNAFVPEKQVVEVALEAFARTNFDFVDCMMIGYAEINQHKIITFDKKLNKYLEAIPHS